MSALQEFLEQAAIVEMDRAHKGTVAFGRPFVARMASEIRDMVAIGSAMRSVIAAAEQRAEDERRAAEQAVIAAVRAEIHATIWTGEGIIGVEASEGMPKTEAALLALDALDTKEGE